MWLVEGEDEEHRFRGWDEAATWYHTLVAGFVAALGEDDRPSAALPSLVPGQSHETTFAHGPDQSTAAVFRLGWERPRVGNDHFTAC